MLEWTARNIMAKQAQSNSQLAVPKSTTTMTSRHPRRTEVMETMSRSMYAATFALGLPTNACDARTIDESTKNIGFSYTKSAPTAMVASRTPMMAGIRSSEAPSPAASESPNVATRASDTVDATTVPAVAQAARALSAPNLRNHRKP